MKAKEIKNEVIMLSTGMRVKRGPTWIWSGQDADKLDPIKTCTGVVLKCSPDWGPHICNISVKWDNGRSYRYRYGLEYQDVIPVD